MTTPVVFADHVVAAGTAPGLTLENPYCVRATVDGTVLARQGAMVAYRGEVTIRTKTQGVRKLLKRAVTGEGLALMEIAGRGDVWLADLAKNAFVLQLADTGPLSLTGKSVLAFGADVGYEIRMVKGAGMTGGGLFNCTFTGDGPVALVADGQPLVIPVTPDAPVFVDTDAVLGWSATLETSINRSEGAKSILKGGSGELYQLRLAGTGFVIVQPSEGPILPKKDGVGEAIDAFFG